MFGMGRPAQISRDEVLQASLAIADADGLDAVTMLAVARRLGVTPMALYRHIASKADLLDALVEGLLTEFSLPPGDLPPDERLRAMGRSIREVARRHPSLFPLLLQRPAVTPESRRVRDSVCAALEEMGLRAAQARRAERLLATVVLGFAASEASGRFRNHPKSVIDQDFACLERAIVLVLDDLLCRSADAGLTQDNCRGSD
jgi:AcrR family transcriptional regulator